jgi:pimeloyl-ACP methyl ester carboxylesterase
VTVGKDLSATGLEGFEERWLDARGVRLRYFVAGRGRPLVAVHGLGGAASNWRAMAPSLAERGRVIVPELPGHGASSALPAPAGVAAYADRVALVLEREAPGEPAVVLGHSFGGVTGLLLAERRPELVGGLLLYAAAGISSRLRRARYLLEISFLLQPGKLIAPHRRTFARSPLLRRLSFGKWGADDPVALPPRVAEGLLAGPLLHTDTATAGRALYDFDVRARLHAVRCPTLVVWGARDQQLPLEDAFDFARRLRAPVRVIAACGHLLVAERPDACVDALDDLLDRVRQLDELPLEAEALRDVRGQRLHP